MWVENGEPPQLTQKGKSITCTMDNSVLLVVSRLSPYSSSILSSTSRSTDQFNYFRKLGPLLYPVATRSDKHACGKPMLTDHDKQTTENREPANEMNKEDPTQSTTVWPQPFTVNLEDLERCARTFFWKSELRFGRWRFKSGDTKTEAQCSCLVYSYRSGRHARKTNWWLLQCRFEQNFVRFLEIVRKIHSIERKASKR